MRKSLLFGLCGILLLTGVSAAKAAERPEPYEYVKNIKVVEGIPVIEYYKIGQEKMPLLILSHGFIGSKNDFFLDTKFVRELADKGFFIIAMDNRGHGDRKEFGFLGNAIKNSKINIYVIRKLIKESADDVSLLINYYEKNYLIDNNRIGMTGCSMGGFITFRAMMNDSRIIAAAPMIGSPAWEDIPQRVTQPLSVDQDEEIMNSLKALSMQYSPNYFPEKFYGRNLLMQNGEQDKHVNINEVKKFYAYIAQNSPQTISLITYPDTEHEVTQEMLAVTTEWLCSKLANGQ